MEALAIYRERGRKDVENPSPERKISNRLHKSDLLVAHRHQALNQRGDIAVLAGEYQFGDSGEQSLWHYPSHQRLNGGDDDQRIAAVCYLIQG